MIGRTILAGALAAVAMFIWSWVAHDMLPLGAMGVSALQNEQAVQDALKTNIGKDGLYLFPVAAAKGEANAKGPEGFLVFHGGSNMEMSPKMLGGEFAIEIVEMVILAFLLAQMGVGLWCMVGYAAAAGVMVALTTNGSYHIWYGFPADYTLAQLIIVIAGYTIGGTVIAFILPKPDAA